MASVVRTSATYSTDPLIVAAMEVLRDRRADSGLFFDFDGVLSPIQDDPETVEPLPGVVETIEALTECVKLVAIISSRNANFLKTRFQSVRNLRIHGLYGLELVDPEGRVVVAKDAEPFLEMIPNLLARAKRELPATVYVEDKKLSIGLHFRRDPSVQHVVEDWANRICTETDLFAQAGRMAVELKPPLKVDKGTTLRSYLPDLKCAWYFGDDVGDLSAFKSVQDWAATSDEFEGLCIGVGNDTIVQPVLEQSDAFLEAPSVVAQLLVDLSRVMRA